jgi:hypothetical protein
MKLTTEELYAEMLSENIGGNWINPKLEPLNNPLFKDNFMIVLEDFYGIHESVNVSIYSVNKRHDGTITIHCKPEIW